MSTADDPNVAAAFGLVIGAGAATALGASVVFFPSLVKLASRRVLAGALGISAGVMTYVSFVEIFQKSVGSFGDAGFSDDTAQIYATVCFFGGVVFMLIIDFIVKCLSKGRHVHSHDHPAEQGLCKEDHDHEHEGGDSHQIVAPHCVCCADDPVAELEDWKKMAGLQEDGSVEVSHEEKAEEENLEIVSPTSDEEHEHIVSTEQGELDGSSHSNKESFGENDKSKESDETGTADEIAAEEQNRKLIRMGINTAVAIGLHNFPEGLATFVAALDDPKVGAVLAIAIGIHNIPEGLCVALPIYYATGNRWKAFGWACVSGLSEPIAALLGWAVLANSFSDELYAVLFGLVGGMMVIISTRELLPTAHRYDPEDTVVTYSFIGGMAIMAISLVLFLL